jgi:hypothetical protein
VDFVESVKYDVIDSYAKLMELVSKVPWPVLTPEAGVASNVDAMGKPTTELAAQIIGFRTVQIRQVDCAI